MIFTPYMGKKKKIEEEGTDEKYETRTQLNEEALKQLCENNENTPRIIGICGDLDEEKTGEIIYGMIALAENSLTYKLKDSKDKESEIVAVYEPFEFVISTLGGSAQEMFALHDMMRMIKERCDICTVGLGKVFSAGTLLLASGTKGKRKIGKNCRVMIHSVIGNNHGSIHLLENEMDEVRVVQEKYIAAMTQETNMTKRYLKKILDRKINAYFTAEEAVELGLADEIF